MSVPGNLPFPFDWRMALPGVADLLNGITYYFAGLLIGMRDARWYLSRTMGLGAAIVCSFVIVNGARTFPEAILTCAIGIAVVATAAWGTFVAGGRYELQPRLARIATTLATASGIVIVGVLSLTVALSFTPRPTYPPYPSYELSSEGQVVKTLRDDVQLLSVNDLSGQPIEQYNDPVARTRFGSEVDSASVRKYPGGNAANRFRYRETGDFFRALRPGSGGVGDPVTWFYIHKERLISAYNNRTERFIGWMGPDGYTEGATPPSQRFEGELQDYFDNGYWNDETRLLPFPGSVYRLDLAHFRIERIYTANPGERVFGASASRSSSRPMAAAETSPLELIATTERIVVQTRDEEILKMSPHPLTTAVGELHVYRPLKASSMPLFVWYSPWSGVPQQVTQFDSAGTAVTQYVLPEQQFVPRPVNWPEVTAEGIATPVAGRAAVEIISRVVEGRPYGGRNVLARRVSWILPLLTGLTCAVLTFQRMRRYAFPFRRSLGWTLAAFAVGPLALLTMLALLEWPALEKCTACGRLRVVTSETCEHCAQPFAPPPVDGTEIFDIA
jgi:hypothetical protein